ncbi:hypothetical protein N234_34980 [Ralstonia pickettii DTP0602]|nr:hypothetical protein N234_34980 [Ralstonia pickettii DTP0602]
MSLSLGHAATLDDIADTELDRLVEMGFDWLWLLSVWQTGPAAQRISRSNAAWRREFVQTLPDLREEDIAGSGFAITRYTVRRDLGGDEALARLHTRARQRGPRLMLDFVWASHECMFVAVNYSPQQSQCFMRTPFRELGEGTVRLQDWLSPAAYDRPGDDLRARGLSLDMPPWGYHAFDVQWID